MQPECGDADNMVGLTITASHRVGSAIQVMLIIAISVQSNAIFGGWCAGYDKSYLTDPRAISHSGFTPVGDTKPSTPLSMTITLS
jgi:hypothetical protein